MLWEQYDVLKPEVMVVGDSNKFHFLVDNEHSITTYAKTPCRNAESFHTKGATDGKDPKKLVEMGRKPCKQCIKNARKFFDVDVKTCTVCGRLNLLHEVSYSSHHIPHAVRGKNTLQICSDCRDEVAEIED